MATERDDGEGDLCFCRGSWSSNIGFQNWQTGDENGKEKVPVGGDGRYGVNVIGKRQQ